MTEEYFYYDESTINASSSSAMPTLSYKDRSVILNELKASLELQLKEWLYNRTYKIRLMKSLKNNLNKQDSRFKKIHLLLNYIKATMKPDETISSLKITYDSHTTLVINYDNLFAITDLLIVILEHVGLDTPNGPKNFHQLKGQKYSFLPRNFLIQQTPILAHINNFKAIKTIHFALGDNLMGRTLNMYCIILFSELIEIIFPSAYEIHFDLNISDINRKFNDAYNPSLITEKEILLMSQKYSELIIANYIITRKIKKHKHFVNYSFTIYDSYQLELHHLFSEEFFQGKKIFLKRSKDIKDDHIIEATKNHQTQQVMIPMQSKSLISDLLSLKKDNQKYKEELNNMILPLRNILLVDYIIKTDFIFNAFDPLLFSEIITILLNATTLSELSLDLFPKDNQCNPSKTFLNANHYFILGDTLNKSINNAYRMNDKDTYEEDTSMVNIKSEEQSCIISYDKIQRILFAHFNENIINLSIVLEEKINQLVTLHLYLYCKENIKNYENYQCAIVFFLMNIIKMIQTNASKIKLEEMTIELNDTHYEYIYDSFQKKNILYSNGFDLSKVRLKTLRLAMSSINTIIPMNKLPIMTLTNLSFHRLSIKDFNTFLTLLTNKKIIFPQLNQLSLEFDYCEEFCFESLKIFLIKSIPITCSKLLITIPDFISERVMIDIIIWYSHNMTNLNKELQMELSCSINNEHIGEQSFRTIYGEQLNNEMKLRGLCMTKINFLSVCSFLCDIMFINNDSLHSHYLPMIYSLYKSALKMKKTLKISILYRICVMINCIVRSLKITLI